MRRLACLLVFVCSGVAHTHEVDDVPSKVQLIEELRGMNSTLRQAQASLDTSLAVDAVEVVKVLNEAQVAWLAEDYPKAALMLMGLVSRPAFKDHPAWPEALEYLGESLHALGLSEAARTYLRQAVEHPRQLPTPWRRRFARLLAIGGGRLTLDELRSLWRRYQDEQGDDEPTREDHAIRYQYAKALVGFEQLNEADEHFAQIPEGDAWYLQALYFRGIVQLRQDQQVKAAEAFEVALAAWQRSRPPPPEKPWLEEVDDDGPAREVVPLELTEEEQLPPEEVTRHERMGAVIHLALARLAAVRRDDATAWNHYRMVPRGDPDFAAALAEASFILFRREQYAWCIRLVDQLLAGRGDDVSNAQLTLWKAQLQARAAAYDESVTTYALLEASLGEAQVQAEADERRIFSESTLAWTDPEESTRARRLEADLITQEEALLEAREIADVLGALIRSDDLLPAVARGREILEKLDARMAHFAQHIELAGRAVHDEEDTELHSGGPPATRADLKALAESQETLRQRMDIFEDQLQAFESTYRKRIASVLESELPVVAALEKALAAEVATARGLRGDLAKLARENVEQYAAEARFGQVDIAWWRKEEMTRKIRLALEEQKVDLDVVENAQNPPPPPPEVAKRPSTEEVDGAAAPGESDESDEGEAPDEAEEPEAPAADDGYEEASTRARLRGALSKNRPAP